MKMDLLRQSLKAHEGLRLKPYTCTAGALSIGYGRNLEDRGISQSEADLMLENDIAECVAELHRAIPGWQKHDSVRQNVLVEMVFNMGMPRLLTFRKMLAALDALDYATAAKELLDSRYATQVGKRAETLAERLRTGKE